MRKFVYWILLSGLLPVLVSCVRENLVEPAVGDGDAVVELGFGFKDFEEVKVETRATLDIIPESRVSNLFLFMFVGEKRYYAHYFDKSSLALTLEDMREESNESWYVVNRTESVERTSGILRIHAPLCTGAEIYLLANIDSDMVNISPEKLNMISTRSELENLVAMLNQEITSRNGLFPMTGTYSGADGAGLVDVTETGIYPSGKTYGRVSVDLERLDAKVMVNVRVATDNELMMAGSDGASTVQTLKEFRPESWRIVNLPKGNYISTKASEDAEVGYFSTEPVMFETVGDEEFTYRNGNGRDTTVSGQVNGFSFYMLQNREAAKRDVKSFHERERRNKDSDGHYVASGDVWTNAPEHGTYMVIKGQVLMDVDVSSEAKRQQLSADVTYYVHLGDIARSLNDYNILRNTAYTYTITIKGVNNIELEVSSSYKDDDFPADPSDVEELEPGAEGMVYVAKESIHTFDAHYGQRVFCFDAAYTDPDAVTWYVKTPFGREGIPDKIGDTEIPSGMDYQWVHFMINDVSDSDLYIFSLDGSRRTANLKSGCPYSHNNLPYPGDGSSRLMDVVQFVDYIKTQKRNMDKGLDNDFRTEFDQDWFDWYNSNNPDGKITDPETLIDGRPGPWFRARIYVTVFVDEFYYERDPITGESDPQLWKRFVNQPNRLMHVLCDNRKSLDKASSLTGSVVTICQRSIQTPYNINDDELDSAWGCETEDETADSYLWLYPDEKDQGKPGARNFGNNSTYNGLYNTVRVWGCLRDGSEVWNDLRWADFLDYNRPDDYKGSREYPIHFLKEDKACLQYSSIMRNRDNNGNGVIDMDEVRWYDASIGQLEFLFLGELGLSDDAKLYPRKYSGADKDDVYPSSHPYSGSPKWAVHIISSSNFESMNLPKVLWAEEGVSISSYKQWGSYSYSVKCVRNLGFKTDKLEYFTKDDSDHRPQDLVEIIKPDVPVTPSSVYRFDCRRVNNKSKRFRTSIELEPYDESSEMARLYEGFATGALLNGTATGVGNYAQLRTMLQSGKSPCPEGYRVPNIREATLIHLFADSKDWWGSDDIWSSRIYTSSYYSLGVFGNGKNAYNAEEPRASWNISSPLYGGEGNINLNGYKSTRIRCVKDWDPLSD